MPAAVGVPEHRVAKVHTRSVKPGPKPRLSRQMIIDRACRILENAPLEAFSLAKLAKELKATSMSLYTYFPNRDALLDAVGDRIFEMFEMPALGNAGWRPLVMEWLAATERLSTKNPAIFKIIFWDRRYSSSWLERWWLPVARIFEAQGLKGRDLAFTMNWFSTSTFSLINAKISAAMSDDPVGSPGVKLVADSDQHLASNLWHILTEEREAALEFGFALLLDDIERVIGRSTTNR